MVCVLVDRGHQPLEGRLAVEGTAALDDVLPVLVAELRDIARDWHRRRVAQRTQALAEDAIADREQQVELLVLGAALLDLLQELHHPARALAAWGALSA